MMYVCLLLIHVRNTGQILLQFGTQIVYEHM